MKIVWSIAFLAVWFALNLRADFVVAPNDRVTTVGNASTLFFQQEGAIQGVYGAKNFNSPVMITGLAFRVDEGTGSQFSLEAVIPRVTIRMSTYSGTFASFSPTYSQSKGADDTLVFDASVTWITRDLDGGGVNPFDLRMVFSTPFPYNPNSGSLLFSYVSTGPYLSGIIVDADARGDSNIGWLGSGFGFPPSPGVFVTQFQVTAIPEPSTTALVLIFAGLLSFRLLK